MVKKIEMTNEQILKKAIKKAVEGGYEHGKLLLKNYKKWKWYIEKMRYSIIFSHSFAKAYWGSKLEYEFKDRIRDNGTQEIVWEKFTPSWIYHQHKMLDEVQAGRNPLKYLEKFL